MSSQTPDPTPQFGTAEFIEPLIDGHAHFMRGALFGVGGALLGLVLYAVVGIATGLEIGYVSLAVGYIVGKAVTTGSQGRVGRRYQIAAALLTYAAVSLAAIPIAIAQASKPHAAAPQTTVRPHVTSDQDAVAPAPSGAEESGSTSTSGQSLLGVVGTLALIGLASPFLELESPVQGMIGLVILFVGIRIAWQIAGARGLKVAALRPPPDDDAPTTLNLSR